MDDSSDESGREITEEDQVDIRKKISNLSFESLLKMKEEMGSKLYNQAVFGVRKQKHRADLKRANKNRPRELSSKIKPNQLRRELNQNIPPAKKFIARDPRFDPLCGEYDAKVFKSNYKFIHDIRMKEKEQLQKELKTCTDPLKQQTIKKLIQRISNQVHENEQNDKAEQEETNEKIEVKTKQKKQKPIYKKKSVQKVESLIEKYNELKKSNRLEKYIQKRSKKLSMKEKQKSKELQI